jgi:predicted permease
MRWYRALLRLYPASFRNEYGREMISVFERRLCDASTPAARIALSIAAIFETLGNALLVHRDLLRQDVHYIGRTLRRSPGFALTAIGIVTLGIGATTAAFSVVDHVVLRPLPFKDPTRLVKIWERPTGYSRMDVSPANYRDWRAAATSFDAWAAYTTTSLNLVGTGDPQRIEVAPVSADLFPTLGVQPMLGRRFTAADDAEGAPGTAILSYALWQTNFGGDPSVVGRRVRLDDEPYQIIGVMPPTFRFPDASTGAWTALQLDANAYQDRTNTYLQTIARLRADVPLESARAEMSLVAAQSRRQYPKENQDIDASVFRLRDELTGSSRLLAEAVGGCAVCLLVIACANLANLLLARALERRREIAVRAALGAGRERIVRQLITESVALAVAGGACGVALASAAVPLLARLVPPSLPIAEPPGIDLRVLAFAAFASIATGLAFGLAPALGVDPTGGSGALREGARTGQHGRERIRSVLVLAEIAASVVLLVVAGLLARSLWTIHQIDPGFGADGVLRVRTSLPLPRYGPTATRVALYRRVLSDVRSLPGVAHAAYTSFAPMTFRGGVWPVSIDGRPTSPIANEVALLRYVTPDFFGTLAIPIVRGRDLADSDTGDRPFVAVVSASFVRRFFPDRDPIGRHFTYAFADREIVGVVADIRARGIERVSEPQVYLSYQQVADNSIVWYAPKDLLVRAASRDADVASLVPSIRALVRAADPQLPVSEVQPLTAIVAGETAPRSVQLRALGLFAAIAIVLAAVGIHGLLSFAVAQRTQEIGVRMALGAAPRDVVAMIAGTAARLGAVGVAVGTLVAFVAGRSMQALLAGVKPGDVEAFGGAIVLTGVMVAVGTLVPTLRALRIDPIVAMRSE